jgi:hypothetical protein
MFLLFGIDLRQDFLEHQLEQCKLTNTFFTFFFIFTIMSLKESVDATENEQPKFTIFFTDETLAFLFRVLYVVKELVGANFYTHILRHLD